MHILDWLCWASRNASDGDTEPLEAFACGERSAASCSAERGASECRPRSANDAATDLGAFRCVESPAPLASLPPAEQARSAELDTRAGVCEAPGMNSAMGSDSHFCRAGV